MDIGGQAVIEGVMMRNKEKYAVAVRLPNGEIKIKQEKNSFPKFFNFVFVRGIVGLAYTLYDGLKALIWSSNQNLSEEEKLTNKEIIGTILLSLLASIFIFVVVPFFSAHLIESEGIIFNVLEGLFRVLLLVGYLATISLMKEVNTLFKYHGAEHKTISCYENKQELTVENVRKFSRFHPRCGTSFIFLVLLLSIVLFSFINGVWWVKLIGRIFLLPVLASISYELIKLSGKYHRAKLVKVLVAPGLWLQRITTKEPSAEQIEVGIVSLKAVIN